MAKQEYRLNGYEVVNMKGVHLKSFGYVGMSEETRSKAFYDACQWAKHDGLLMHGEVEVREIMVVYTRKYKPKVPKAPETKADEFTIPKMPSLDQRAQLA